MRRTGRTPAFTAAVVTACLLGTASQVDSAAAAGSCGQASGHWAPAGYVSVAAYGARGDGVTDDAAAVQCAVNSGSDVWFPTGTYELGASVSLPTALTVTGESDSATPTVIRGSVGGLVFGETAAATNTTRTGTITLQDLFFDSIQVGVNGTKTSAVLERNVFSDARGHISQLNSPANQQLVLNRLTGTSRVTDSVFLHGDRSTDAVAMSLYRTTGLSIQRNVVGLELSESEWLEDWPGHHNWTDRSSDGTTNPSPARVSLPAKLATLRTALGLGDSQGHYRSGLYTGFDTLLNVDSNIFDADPATPSVRDHAAYLKGVSGRYIRNWVRGWPNAAEGGVKVRNSDGPLTVGANRLVDTPVLLYVYSDPTYPLTLREVDVCANVLEVATLDDPTHAGITYYENVQPTGLSGIRAYRNTFVDPTHTTGVIAGQLSPAVLSQTEANAFTVYASNSYQDTGGTVPVTVPAGITLAPVAGAPATDACSGLTVPSYALPAYGR
ncbi:glycosyl hydrolase family 28-related protein [Streptomyces sp. NPDC060209]|uniref:glycosyl hydrolase family 28-related protein n=1 Tax=Streptomyces sp. NPDC060209 TaxID=3347073 RepID=UPI0036626DCE